MDISDKLNEAVERNIFVPEHQNKPELKEMLRDFIPLAVHQYTVNEVQEVNGWQIYLVVYLKLTV